MLKIYLKRDISLDNLDENEKTKVKDWLYSNMSLYESIHKI